jgi:hypothetical protein
MYIHILIPTDGSGARGKLSSTACHESYFIAHQRRGAADRGKYRQADYNHFGKASSSTTRDLRGSRRIKIVGKVLRSD